MVHTDKEREIDKHYVENARDVAKNGDLGLFNDEDLCISLVTMLCHSTGHTVTATLLSSILSSCTDYRRGAMVSHERSVPLVRSTVCNILMPPVGGFSERLC